MRLTQPSHAEEALTIAAINEAVYSDQDWTRIAPYGAHPNAIGLQLFDRDGARSMVSALRSEKERAGRDFEGLPVFVGHPDDAGWARDNRHAMADTGAKVFGRITDLQDRHDGLYGRIAWNSDGRPLVSGDAAPYAFQSPRWGMVRVTRGGHQAFRPVLLHSIGLTNLPNIPESYIGLNERVEQWLNWGFNGEPARAEINAIAEAVKAYIRENGLDPQRDYDAAFSAVRKAQPALFES